MRVSSLLASATSESRGAALPRGLPPLPLAAARSGGRVALLPVAVTLPRTVSAATAAAAAAAAGATRAARPFAFAEAFAAIGRPVLIAAGAASGAATVVRLCVLALGATLPVVPSSSESS